MNTNKNALRVGRNFFLATVSLLFAGNIMAQNSFFVSITGANKAKWNSGSTARNFEGDVLGYGFTHQLTNPTPATGAASANTRSHKAITFTKAIDLVSPKILAALTTGEVLERVTFTFTGLVGSQQGMPIYTITLLNARITDVQCNYGTTKSESSGYAAPGANMDFERISLVYQQIEWTNKNGNITSSDAWK